MHSLYLIYSELGSIGQWKVGVSGNLPERFESIKTANPNIVKYAATYPIENKDIAYKVEALLKKHFRQHKISGEWILHEVLNPELFLRLCQKYENAITIHLEIEKNIKNNYDN